MRLNLKYIVQTARCIVHTLYLIPIILLLSSCINERIDEPAEEVQTAKTSFYLSLNVTLPSSDNTRSTTTDQGESSSGTNEGIDQERIITSAEIYFFDNNTHEKLLSIITDKIKIESDDEGYSLYSELKADDLRSLFSGSKVNVYVIANNDPLKGITSETDIQDATFNTDGISFPNHKSRLFSMSTSGMTCPMSNKDFYQLDLSSVTIPSDASDQVVFNLIKGFFSGTYTDDEGKSAKLWEMTKIKGPLELERSVARIDLKKEVNEDGTTEKKLQLPTDKFHGPNGETVKLKLTAMQLFNISKSAFVFRHTSPGDNTIGTRTGASATVFGIENGNANYGKTDADNNTYYNWVYDNDWSEKTLSNINTDNLTIKNSSYFFNQSITTIDNDNINWDANYDNSGISSYSAITSSANENNLPLKNYVEKTNNNYVPWFYVMENTLPSTDLMGIPFSTGIAFYFQVILVDSEGKEISSNVEGKESDFRITRSDGYYQEPIYRKLISTDNPGYFLVYKYLIEHNNTATGNVDGGTGRKENLGPMQIGIVRNNIYQLNITGIKDLPSPNEPDNMYLSVDVRVLAWAKRDIHVSF